ncbi:MAG: hypothetical protein ABEI98_03675 [Halorhabdus sp.]
MVEVSYYCPYCGAVTSVDRAPELRDGSVTRRPKPDLEYAGPTEDVETADGIEFVCLGNGDAPAQPPDRGQRATETAVGRPDGPVPGKDGCGRTFYLHYYRGPDWIESEV